MGSALSAPAPPRLLAADAASQAFLARHDAFVFDCDGVLWHGLNPIPGAKETILGLRRSGRKVLFCTNNSTKARRDYCDAFAERLGVEVAEEDVVCSSWAAAEYLRNCGDARADKSKVLCFGMSGLSDELRIAGYDVVGGPDWDAKTPAELEEELDIETLDAEIGAVVSGLDRNINYYKVSMAAAYVAAGRLYVATNTDTTYPMKPNGTTSPGAGLSSAAVLGTVGRDAPDAVAGKPSALLGKTICEAFGLTPERTCMVGDRLDTDMLFAHNAGFSQLAVLSGVITEADIEANKDAAVAPHFMASSVQVLADLLAEEEAKESSA
eukprot:CAMPEP_0118883074 /NCGR_PEP_ID=MMETSP1163-20130328/22208_1 /TAXON_ID=124430 /ORGANISM="Phaeomonas parva, Strain CCMP2877" /LENGTH=323 /DNA_ID=CAMNT_0006820365 /DNA_START=66 /DNA_END=1037 /DNA_ORIENTATION=+